MSADHFFIWSGIATVCVGLIAAAVRIRQLRDATYAILARLMAAEKRSESICSDLDLRISKLKAWSDSFVALHEHISRQESARVDEINVRLVNLETENKPIVPEKPDDDDPFAGPRSWAAQAAAAERGSGVRSLA